MKLTTQDCFVSGRLVSVPMMSDSKVKECAEAISTALNITAECAKGYQGYYQFAIYVPFSCLKSVLYQYTDDHITFRFAGTDFYVSDYRESPIWKEVNMMEANQLKEARRMPAGNYVAVDDVVDVSVNFIRDDELFNKLKRRDQFTARIVSFEDNFIVLDTSTALNACQVELRYGHIKTMVASPDIKKEDKAPCF